MDSLSSPKTIHIKKLYWRILILFSFIVVVVTTLLVWGYAYSNDEQHSYWNVYFHTYNEKYHLPQYYINEHSSVYDTNYFSVGGIAGISPIYIYGEGPYPLRNIEMQFAFNNIQWPAPNVRMLLRVPPSSPSVQLGVEHLLPGPGLPVMAGYSLIAWGGFRSWPGGSSNFGPAPIPGLGSAPFPLSTTDWLGENAPNANYYPMYVYLGTHPDVTALTDNSFWSIQLGMEDKNLNIDNRLAVANAPSPLIEHTRAIVGEYTHSNFITDVIVDNLWHMPIAPIQFKLQAANAFEFAPITGITINNPHHITSEFVGLDWMGGDIALAVIPSPDLGVGTHTEIVTSYQRGHVRSYNNDPILDINDRMSFTWQNAHPLAGSTALDPAHRTEFEVRFRVERPATKIEIPTAEGPTRNTTVHVNYTYRDPNPNPDYYTYNNTTPGFSYNIVDNAGDREIHIIIPPPRYTFFDFDPADPNRNAICRDSGDPLPITNLPPGYGVISATVDPDGNLVVVIGRTFYTITFHLRGGTVQGYGTGPIVREYRIPGYEIGTGGPFTVPTDPSINQYGVPANPTPPVLPQLGNNVKFHGWREVDSAGVPITPGPHNHAAVGSAPLPPSDISDLIVSGNRYFEAVYGYWFDFIKTNMRIFEYPPVAEPRNGAVFELHIQDFGTWDTSDPLNPIFNSVAAYTSRPSGACGIDGRVVIGYGYTIGLEVRYSSGMWSWPVALTIQRHMHEITPPANHKLPEAPWWAVDLQYGVPGPLQPYDGGFQGMSPHAPSWWQAIYGWINPDAPPPVIIDNVLHVGNEPYIIEFIKATRYPHFNYQLGQPWDWVTLPGAQFVLERQETFGFPWVYVATSTVSGADGRVIFEYSLPPNSPGTYRLREIVAPVGFNLPQTGYWRIQTDANGDIGTLNFGESGSHIFWLVSSISGAYVPGEGWHIPNIPTREWPIYKTSWTIYSDFDSREYLPGAVFSLFVYNGPIEPGPDINLLLTSDMIGPAEDGYMWSYVTSRTSGGQGSPMMFPMMVGRHYQLLEVAPPQGFAPPDGQWRIFPTTYDPFPDGQWLNVTPIGGAPAPVIVERPIYFLPWLSQPNPNPYLYIGNFPQFQLPLTGGIGTIVFSVLGFTALGTGGVSSAWLIKRKRRKGYSKVSTKPRFTKIKAPAKGRGRRQY